MASSTTHDVLIVGAGPAGCVAAIVLARAGVRVRMFDRARFPRDKLCGDSINPGTLAILRRLALGAVPGREGLPIHGMIVTGPRGAGVTARYPPGVFGRTMARRELDLSLLEHAVEAGVQFEESVHVLGPSLSSTSASSEPRVDGVRVRTGRGACRVPAAITIAADGRRSVFAFGLGLARHPLRPRRWAVGGYFEGVSGLSSFGEMHVRAGHYIGVAPLPGGLANGCLVTPRLHSLFSELARGDSSEIAGRRRDLAAVLAAALRSDPHLGPRFARARLLGLPLALGPLAVDAHRCGVPGLLLAGDAAGFIDPITGDGLRFAIRGAELAAESTLSALSGGGLDGHLVLAACRRREFSRKERFNRVLRHIVEHPAAVRAAAMGASVLPQAVRAIVGVAGDVADG